jgi:hypothetical protein
VGVPAILTTWVFPIVFVIAAAGVLVDVFRGAGRSALPARLACIPLVFYAGDALAGDNRPPMERLWKGVVVALLALACLGVWWRAWRARRADHGARRQAWRADLPSEPG